jgi:carboxylesterase type B
VCKSKVSVCPVIISVPPSLVVCNPMKESSERDREEAEDLDFETSDRDGDIFQLENIDADIAKELNQLTLAEREDILNDIHGVTEVLDEDPAFVKKALDDLEMWIATKGTNNNKSVEAYNKAASQSPEYVQRKDFRRMFLRADRFNAEHAADRILRFFDKKLELFGPSKLCQDIKLADLSPSDRDCLDHLHGQYMPVRDAGGRPIIFAFPSAFANYKGNYDGAVS